MLRIYLAILALGVGISQAGPVQAKPKRSKRAIAKVKVDPKMAPIHQAIRDGKKLQAVKLYRDLHNKLPIAGAKLGVEVETYNMGMPSLEGVRRLLWKGKDKKAGQLLARIYPSISKEKLAALLAKEKANMQPGDAKTVEKHIQAKSLQAALYAAHRLNPSQPIPALCWELNGKIQGK